MGRIGRSVGRRGRAVDEGFTLVELLVSTMVTAVALAMITTLLIAVSRTTSDSNATRSATGSAANAINEISRVLRSAAATATGTDSSGNQTLPSAAVVCDSTAAATPTALTVTSNIGGTAVAPTPVKVAFAVNASGQLTEAQAVATSAGGLWTYGPLGTARTIAAPLVTSGTALFTYSDSTGAVLTPAASGLTATQCGQVASVTVTVTVANPQVRNGSAPVVLTSQVGMPNVALTGGGS